MRSMIIPMKEFVCQCGNTYFKTRKGLCEECAIMSKNQQDFCACGRKKKKDSIQCCVCIGRPEPEKKIALARIKIVNAQRSRNPYLKCEGFTLAGKKTPCPMGEHPASVKRDGYWCANKCAYCWNMEAEEERRIAIEDYKKQCNNRRITA